MNKDDEINVLFDDQIFGGQSFGGVSRYFVELYLHLLASGQAKPEISVRYSPNIYLKRQLASHVKVRPVEIAGLGRLGSLCGRKLNQLATRRIIRRNEHDLYHPTSYSSRYVPLNKKPLVVTVYDMIDEICNGGVGSAKASESKKTICRQADKIVAISHSTKSDLVRLFDIDPEKIEVIHLSGGFPTPTRKKTNQELGLPEKYILYVGGRQFYKNFNRFVEASASLIGQTKDMYVICTGRSFNEGEKNLLEHYKVSQNFRAYFCDEDDFYHLYNNAQFFVFPSEYEGFGIPILEAFSARCPCVISNVSSFPEVAGDAALYFDPLNTADISSKMMDLANDKKLQNTLVEKGEQRLKQFSWENTARETLAVYRELIETKSS